MSLDMSREKVQAIWRRCDAIAAPIWGFVGILWLIRIVTQTPQEKRLRELRESLRRFRTAGRER